MFIPYGVKSKNAPWKGSQTHPYPISTLIPIYYLTFMRPGKKGGVGGGLRQTMAQECVSSRFQRRADTVLLYREIL